MVEFGPKDGPVWSCLFKHDPPVQVETATMPVNISDFSCALQIMTSLLDAIYKLSSASLVLLASQWTPPTSASDWLLTYRASLLLPLLLSSLLFGFLNGILVGFRSQHMLSSWYFVPSSEVNGLCYGNTEMPSN